MEILGVGIAGGIGAISRYLITIWISNKIEGSFPWGTFIINISGAFLLGLISTVSFPLLHIPSAYKTVITIGLIGAYTTFSTFSFESFNLISEGSFLEAFLNLFLSPFLGILTALLGIEIAKALFR